MAQQLLTHPLALTIIFAGIGAQVLKSIIYGIKYKTFHPRDLIVTGGIPSSHSALMVGISTTIYFMESYSTTFFIALALTFVVIVDAMGVRRTAGEEGRIIHQLIKKTKLKLKEPHYSLGHTPAQVTVGAILGFVVAVVINLVV